MTDSKHCWTVFHFFKNETKIAKVATFEILLKKYQDYATCVLFMGGEWHENKLVNMLKIAKSMQYKTCLYTGEETVSKIILNNLDWIKTGKWRAHLGGLNSEITNQKFIQIKSNTIQNNISI